MQHAARINLLQPFLDSIEVLARFGSGLCFWPCMSMGRAAQFDSNSVQVQSKLFSGSVGVHTMQSPLFVACLSCAPVLPSDFHSFCSDFFGSYQANAVSLLGAEKKRARQYSITCTILDHHHRHRPPSPPPPQEQVPTSLALLEAGGSQRLAIAQSRHSDKQTPNHQTNIEPLTSVNLLEHVQTTSMSTNSPRPNFWACQCAIAIPFLSRWHISLSHVHIFSTFSESSLALPSAVDSEMPETSTITPDRRAEDNGTTGNERRKTHRSCRAALDALRT